MASLLVCLESNFSVIVMLVVLSQIHYYFSGNIRLTNSWHFGISAFPLAHTAHAHTHTHGHRRNNTTKEGNKNNSNKSFVLSIFAFYHYHGCSGCQITSVVCYIGAGVAAQAFYIKRKHQLICL